MYLLEDRILFDGAAAADVAAAAQQAAEEAAAQEQSDAQDQQNDDSDQQQDDSSHENYDGYVAADQAPDGVNIDQLLAEATNVDTDGDVHVMLISSSLENADELAAAADENTIVIRYDARTTTVEQLLEQIQDTLGDHKIDALGIASSGELGEMEIFADETTSLQNIESEIQQQFWDGIEQLLAEDGRVDFFNSGLAADADGQALIESISDIIDHEVAASTDLTGAESLFGDWTLEYGDVDLAETYFSSDALTDFGSVLTVDGDEAAPTDQVAFINEHVMGSDDIIGQLEAQGFDVVLLDGDSDALEQMNEYLAGRDNVDAIHLITHGNDGTFMLGDTQVDVDFVNTHNAEFAALGSHLSEDGDIMIYGCDTAGNAEGELLVDTIAQITGADVAASTDGIGLGGDAENWDLEYAYGVVGPHIVIHDYQYHLATITVLNTSDSAVGSLRWAVANAGSGDTIVFDDTIAGDTITLSSAITIDKNLTIFSSPSDVMRVTTSDTSERIFTVDDSDPGTNVTVVINNMIIQRNGTFIGNGGLVYNAETLTLAGTRQYDGKATGNGGAIYNTATGILGVAGDDGYADFQYSSAGGNGGAIYNLGTLALYGADFDESTAVNGGAIYSTGSIEFSGQSIYTNFSATGSGGAIYLESTASISYNASYYETLHLDGDSGTEAAGAGGGIYAAGDLNLNNVWIRETNAGTYGGGVYVGGDLTMAGSLIQDTEAETHGGSVYMATASTITMSGDNTLGALDLTGANHGIYFNGNGILTMNDATVTWNGDAGFHAVLADGNLTIDGTGGTFSRETSSTSAIIGAVDMTISATAFTANAGIDIQVSGDLDISSTTFDSNATISFIAGADNDHSLTISSTTIEIGNFTLGDNQVVTLAADTELTVERTFTAGSNAYVDLATNSTTMILNAGYAMVGTTGGVVTGSGGELRVSGFTEGEDQSISYTFNVGSVSGGTYYNTPVDISMTGATVAADAYLSVVVNPSQPPDMGSSGEYVARYLIAGSSAITDYTAAVDFDYLGSDVNTSGSDTFYNQQGEIIDEVTGEVGWTILAATPTPVTGGTLAFTGLSSLGYFASFGVSADTDFVVTNTDDSGHGSLRWAVTGANTLGGDNTITFDSTVFGAGTATITLTSGELSITSTGTVTIDALISSAPTKITVSAGDDSRVFTIDAASDVTISNGLVITAGNGTGTTTPANDGWGGAIYNAGDLTITNSQVTNSNATIAGGGIYNAPTGTLTLLTNDTAGTSGNFATVISGNSAGVAVTADVLGSRGQGGGVYNAGTLSATTTWDLTLGDGVTEVATTISGNTAHYTTTDYGTDADPTLDGQGGGIYNGFGETVTVRNSVVSGNTAAAGGGVYNLGTLSLVTSNDRTNALGYAAIKDNLTPSASANTATMTAAGVFNTLGTVTLQSDWVDTGKTLPDEYTTPMSRIEGNTSTIAGGTGGIYNNGTITFASSNAEIAGSIYNNTGGAGAVGIVGGVGGVYNAGGGSFTVASTTNSGLIDGNTGGAGLTGGDSGAATDGGAGGILTIVGIDGSVPGSSTNSHLIISNNTGGAGGKGAEGADGADGGAGGISLGSNTLTLTYITVSGNTGGAGGAAGDADHDAGLSGGGGVDNAMSGTVLSYMTIDGNSATAGGGVQNTGTITINNSTISNNTGTNGGGIYGSGSGSTTIENSTIAFNSGTNGGGIYYYESSGLSLNFVTVGRNTGGGVYLYGSSGSNTITNSLLSNNGALVNDVYFRLDDDGDPIGSISISNSVFGTNNEDERGGSTNVDLITNADYANVRLDSALRSSYGPTQVLAVQQDSTAIAAGSLFATPYTDQRGIMRHNDPTPGSVYPSVSAPTAGAYEYVETMTYTVTNDSDSVSTEGSLRWAIAQANAHVAEDGHDRIVFDASFFDGTETITVGSVLTITDGVVIEGLGERGGSDLVIISGDDTYQIFNIDSAGDTWNDGVSINVIVSGLTMTAGDAADGGAVYVAADMSLDLEKVTVSASNAISDGGGIYNAGTLTLTRSTVTGNTATNNGGNIYSSGTLTINDSTISGGTLSSGENAVNGGGIYVDGASAVLNVYGSTISGNSATVNGGGIYIANSAANSVNLYNSTVAKNTAGTTGGQIYSNGENIGLYNATVYTDLMGNAIGGTGTLNGNSTLSYGGITLTNSLTYSYAVTALTHDAIFGSGDDHLADNGGWTYTIAILNDAHVVNQGSSDATSYDQRGYEANGTRDIGAYEYNGYVAVNESTGTKYSSIQAAEDAAVNGDVISLAGTRILEGSVVTIDVGIVLAGYGQGVTVISGGDANQVLNVYNNSADITVKLEDLTVTEGNNSSTNGGAIYNAENLVLESVTVENSTAGTNNGGGIYNAGNLNIYYSTLNSNIAADGAAVYNASGATMVIENSNILYNAASANGGGVYSAGTLYMENSAAAYNTAVADGAGLYLTGNQNIVINSTIAHNYADGNGGGIVYAAADPNNSTLSLTNVTIAYNHADYDGGGAGNGGGVYFSAGTLTVNNTILAMNYNGNSSSTTTNDFYQTGSNSTLRDLGYNLVGTSNPTGWTAVGDDIYTYGSDPDIFATGLIADNGGWSWSLALASGSDAIDAGSNSGTLTYDQRGYVYNSMGGNATGSNMTRDIGAYEYNGYVGTLEYVNRSGTNVTEYYTTVQAAIDAAVQDPDLATIDYTLNLVNTRIVESEVFLSNDITINGSAYGRTVISADNQGRVFYSANAMTVSIDKVTMTDGKVYEATNFDAPWSRSGGGLYVDGLSGVTSSLTLTNVTISNSVAEGDGGGIYVAANATLNATNVAVLYNTAMNIAGGVYNAGTARFTTSTIAWNTAYENAGAAFNMAALTLQDSTVAHNLTINGTYGGVDQYESATDGISTLYTIGGIWNYNGTLTSQNTIIGYNYQGAYSSTWDFGRIYALNKEGKAATTPLISDGGYNIIGNQTGTWSAKFPNYYFNMLGPGATGYNHNISTTGRAFTSGRPGDFGGWTYTMALYDAGIAVDAGTGELADQRGYGVNSSRDIGAYEYHGSVVTSGNYWNINAAIFAAASGDTITLVDSRILETNIHVNKDITITGGSSTLVTGDHQGRVFYITADVTAAFNTMIISEGYAGRGANAVTPAEGTGAGIYNAGTLTLTDVSAVDNYAQISGGGVYNAGSLTVAMSEDSTTDIFYDGNLALQTGAAIFSSSSATALSVTGNAYKATHYSQGLIQFTNNIASSGAALYSDGAATVMVSKVEMTHNRATENGGAFAIVNNNGQTAAISEVTMSYNLAEANGGVFYVNNSGEMTMDFVNMEYNVAGIAGGAGYWNNSGSLTVTTESDGRTDYYSGINYNYAVTGNGGAFYFISSDNLTIQGVENVTTSGTIVNNNQTYAGHGGAIYMNSAGNLTIQHYTSFADNSATSSYDGGTIYFVNSGDMTIHWACMVSSSGTTARNGGLVYMDQSGDFLMDYNSWLRGTSNGSPVVASGNGGAMYMSNSGDFTINYGQIYYSHATNGGALYMVTSGNISLTDADIYGNEATSNGGAFYYDGLNADVAGGKGTFTMVKSAINGINGSGSGAGGSGGAIYQETGTLNITNSTLAYNTAGSYGGAIYMGADSTLSLTFATVAYNSASAGTDTGYAIYMLESSGSSFSSVNSIYFNTQLESSIGQITLGASVAVSSSTYNVYSHYDSRFAGTGNITDYQTIHDQLYLDTGLKYHANYRTLSLALMYEQSIALSAGTNISGITTDQRGNNRVGTNASGDSYITPSIGAFEPLYYITVTSHEDTAKLEGVIYTGGANAPNQYFSDAQVDGITLREAAFWLDTYDFVTAQNTTGGIARYESLQVFEGNTAPTAVYDGSTPLTQVAYADLDAANEWAWYNNQVVLAINPAGHTITYDTSTTSANNFTDPWVSDLHDTNRYVKFDTSSMGSTTITLQYDDINVGAHGELPGFDNKEIQVSTTPGGYETFSRWNGSMTDVAFVGSGYNENVYLAQNDDSRIVVSGNDSSRIFNIRAGSTTLNNLTVTNGADSDTGGAILNADTLVLNNVLVKDSVVTDTQSTTTSGGQGGGIYSSWNLTLNDSTVMNNKAYALESTSKLNSGQGGGIYSTGWMLAINRSLVTANETIGATHASGTTDKYYAQGGGVYSDSPSLFVYNSTVSANNNDASMVQPYTFGDGTKTSASGRGSAFYITDSASLVYFYNDTIVYNTVDGPVAGTVTNHPTSAVYTDGGGTYRIINTLAAENNHSDIFIGSGTAITENYNIIATHSGFTASATDILGDIYGEVANLHLSDTLLYNGGKTMNYRLLEGSVAFASGFDLTASGITTDQRGAPRVDTVDWNYDIGAYQALTTIHVTSDADSADGTYTDTTFDFTAGQNTMGWASNDVTFRMALNMIDSTFNVSYQSHPNRINEPGSIATGTIDIDSSSVNWVDNTVTLNAALRVYLGVTINGAIGTSDVTFDAGETNMFRVMTINDTYNANRVNVAINDAIFTNGHAMGSGTAGYGGGIYSVENLTLSNVTITANRAAGLGGGIYSLGGDLTINGTGNSITNNTAGSHGGGIYYENNTLALTDITISGNTSTTGHGGGVYAGSATVTFNGALISSNTATAGHGGGLYALSSDVTIGAGTTYSMISTNTAGLNGGGIFKQGGTLTINEALIGGTASATGNTAGGSGGGIYNVSGAMTLNKGTVAYNAAGADGGGIYSDSALTIVNSTLAYNTANNHGGGIYFSSAGNTLSITYATIAYNHADNDDSGAGSGGGVYAEQGSIYMINSIVASNYNGSGTTTADDFYINTTLIGSTNITYSGVGTANDSSYFSGAGMKYGSAIVNLGLGTELESFNSSAPMLYLSASSTLANAGTAIAVTTSQNNVTRDGTTPDMGAYENNPTGQTYYYVGGPAGDVTAEANWNTQVDGGGAAATTFDLVDGLFIFDGDAPAGSAVTLSATWNVNSRSTVQVVDSFDFTIAAGGELTVTAASVGTMVGISVATGGTFDIATTATSGMDLTSAASGTTVTYSYAGNQSIYTINYGNLTISNGYTKSSSGTTAITVNNNLTLSGGSTLSVAGDLTVTGTTSGTGNITATAGDIAFTGAVNLTGNITATTGSVAFDGNVALTGDISAAAGTVTFGDAATDTASLTSSTVTAATVDVNAALIVSGSTVTGTTQLNVYDSVTAMGSTHSTLYSTDFNFDESKNVAVSGANTALTFNVGAQDVNYYGSTGSPVGADFNIDVTNVAVDSATGSFEVSTTGNIDINNIVTGDDSAVLGTLVFTGDTIEISNVVFSTAGVTLNNTSTMSIGGVFTVNQDLLITGPVSLTGSTAVNITSSSGNLGLTGTVTGNGKDLVLTTSTAGNTVSTGTFNDLGALTINAVSGSVDMQGSITATSIDVTGDATVSANATITSSGGALTFNDALATASGVTTTIDSAGGALTVSGDFDAGTNSSATIKSGGASMDFTGDFDGASGSTVTLDAGGGSANFTGATVDITANNLSLVNTTAAFTNDADYAMVIGGTLSLDSNSTLPLSTATALDAVNISNAGTISNPGAAAINFSGYFTNTGTLAVTTLTADGAATQTMTGDFAVSAFNFNNTSGGVTLSGASTLTTSSFAFNQDGLFRIGNGDVTINNTDVTGDGANRYFTATGSGYLKMIVTNAGTTSFWFGNETYYYNFNVQSNLGAGSVGFRVFNYVTADGQPGDSTNQIVDENKTIEKSFVASNTGALELNLGRPATLDPGGSQFTLGSSNLYVYDAWTQANFSAVTLANNSTFTYAMAGTDFSPVFSGLNVDQQTNRYLRLFGLQLPAHQYLEEPYVPDVMSVPGGVSFPEFDATLKAPTIYRLRAGVPPVGDLSTVVPAGYINATDAGFRIIGGDVNPYSGIVNGEYDMNSMYHDFDNVLVIDKDNSSSYVDREILDSQGEDFSNYADSNISSHPGFKSDVERLLEEVIAG